MYQQDSTIRLHIYPYTNIIRPTDRIYKNFQLPTLYNTGYKHTCIYVQGFVLGKKQKTTKKSDYLILSIESAMEKNRIVKYVKILG